MNSNGNDPDNYIGGPIHSPLPQQIAIVDDQTTFAKAATKAIERRSTNVDWDEPLLIGDIGGILKQFKLWKSELPRVEVFYAIKCNPLMPIVNTLAALGCGFDCASKNEMKLILGSGVNADRIIYAHTCKVVSHLRYAKDKGIRMMTFDNEEELLKVKRVFPEASLVLRIKSVDKQAKNCFGDKFGASVEYSKQLILKARELDLNIIGTSFHVGSGSPNPDSFRVAVEQSRTLFDFAKQVGFSFHLLDIGGGFPGTEEAENLVPFKSMTVAIRKALDENFPAGSGVRIIAEPGRYFPGRAFVLATCVHSKKENEGRVSYYIPDTVCNDFYIIFLEKTKMHPVTLQPAEGPERPTTVYGVTCWGDDIVAKDTRLAEINVGDWMLWKDIGGYSTLTSVGFNGFVTHCACYFITKSNWEELQKCCKDTSFLPSTRTTM